MHACVDCQIYYRIVENAHTAESKRIVVAAGSARLDLYRLTCRENSNNKWLLVVLNNQN